MVIKKKAIKKETIPQNVSIDEQAINEIIERGGKTTLENQPPPEQETRFTLRLPYKLIDMIDENRKKRIGNVSRNQWIIEAVSTKLESK